MQHTPDHKAGRSPLFFATGLCIAAAVAISFDQYGRAYFGKNHDFESMISEHPLEIRTPRALSDFERNSGKIAWAYIARNTRPETGLVDSVAGFPSTTLWDQGSYVLGLISAFKLDLVNAAEFESRVDKLLTSFEEIELYHGLLPNKVYNTKSLTMTNYVNQVVEGGIGWSALDVARMLVAFRTLERHAPKYGDRIRTLLAAWSIVSIAANGELFGATPGEQSVEYLQEGRIGYEHYGARAAALWGIDVSQAISARRILDWKTIERVQVPVDLRTANSFGAITPTLSEPYVLLGLELGLDSEARQLASQVYRAQEARFIRTGQATMVSEDHLDRPPHFAYSSVHANGDDWAVVTESGEKFPDLRTVSVKASFGWHALLGTEYTNVMVQHVQHLGDVEEGWAAGRYEINGEPNQIYTLNTNAVILEALHFISFGPLWQVR